MAKEKIFNRSVSFLDGDAMIVKVEVEVRQFDPVEKRDWITLEKFHENLEVSISGDYGRGCGQIVDEINPRTEGQKRLVEIWNIHHLGGCMAGTQKQYQYLEGQYVTDYDEFIQKFGTYVANDHSKEEAYKALLEMYGIAPWEGKAKALFDYAKKSMGNDPFQYIVGVPGSRWDKGHDSKDYCVRCFFMILRGIYIDRGYKYGTSWLSVKVPDNIQETLSEIIDTIRFEEVERAEQQEHNIECGKSCVEEVLELRPDLDEDDAKVFLCLGQALGFNVGEMKEIFHCERKLYYSVGGIEYYAGEYDALEDKARDNLMGDSFLWKEAVRDGATELGLEDWADQIIQSDGWGSVLGTWDGCENSEEVEGETIYYTRA